MRRSEFTAVWDQLSAELRRQLMQHPARRLAPEDVDELDRAGARAVHALWLDSRPGYPRQWATSWQFQRFVEHYRDSETVRPARRQQDLERWPHVASPADDGHGPASGTIGPRPPLPAGSRVAPSGLFGFLRAGRAAWRS